MRRQSLNEGGQVARLGRGGSMSSGKWQGIPPWKTPLASLAGCLDGSTRREGEGRVPADWSVWVWFSVPGAFVQMGRAGEMRRARGGHGDCVLDTPRVRSQVPQSHGGASGLRGCGARGTRTAGILWDRRRVWHSKSVCCLRPSREHRQGTPEKRARSGTEALPAWVP